MTFAIVIFAVGLFMFFIMGKTEQVTDKKILKYFLDLSPFEVKEFANLSYKMAKFMGVLLMFISSSILLVESKDYLYTNNISYFENIKLLTTRVTDIQISDNFGVDFISIDTDKNTFHLLKNRFIDDNKISLGDSIEIEYFEKGLGTESILIFEVLSIRTHQ